jgi:hypothetical protein
VTKATEYGLQKDAAEEAAPHVCKYQDPRDPNEFKRRQYITALNVLAELKCRDPGFRPFDTVWRILAREIALIP